MSHDLCGDLENFELQIVIEIFLRKLLNVALTNVF